MGVCHDSCNPPCSYGCELRQKGVGVAPSAMPSRMNSVAPPKANPVWERGIVYDDRPDGSRMPVLSPKTGKPLRVKEHAENRHTIREGLKRNKASPIR